MNNAVSINNVSVILRGHKALKNVSIDIAEGSFLSVIGPNGAGKTTLLTVINGLGRIVSGSLEVCGQNISNRNISKIRSEIGYVPQHVSCDARSPISVKDAVSIGRYGKVGIFGRWTNIDEKAVVNAMEVVGIGGLSEKPVGQLSGGERQKVSIARALAQEPQILLFDEPTSSLDPKSQNDILNLIESFYKSKKYTIVFVTHVLSHIPNICTDIVLLKDGKITYAGNAKDGFEERKLSDLYGCPIRISNINGRRHFHAGNDHV